MCPKWTVSGRQPPWRPRSGRRPWPPPRGTPPGTGALRWTPAPDPRMTRPVGRRGAESLAPPTLRTPMSCSRLDRTFHDAADDLAAEHKEHDYERQSGHSSRGKDNRVYGVVAVRDEAQR